MQKWITTLATLALCASALTFPAQPASAARGLSKNDVLTIRQGKFFLHGKRFAEISFNKFDLFWNLYGLLKDGKGDTQEYRDAVASQDQALRELHEMGFHSIRFFASPWANLGFLPIFDDPVKRETVFHKAEDTALDLCDKNDIKVIYSLGSACFTDTQLTPNGWIRGEVQERELVADPNSRGRQDLYRYIDDVVTRYKNRKTILMWEISNEVTLDCDIMPDKGNIAGGERKPNLLDVAHFFDGVAKRIKADDPVHLVNSGGSSMRGCQWNQYTKHAWILDTVEEQDKALDLLYHNSAIDIVDIHYYVNNKGVNEVVKGPDGTNVPMNIERYVQAAASIGKPLMVGETGTGGAVKNDDPKNKKIYDETPDYFDAYTEPTAAKWVQSLCDEIVSAGPQLAYFWSYSTDHAPNKKAINWNIKKGEADPVLAVILDANKRLKAKLGAQ